MPLFDDKQIRDLVGNRASGDYELDLRGVSAEHARIAIERMLGSVDTWFTAVVRGDLALG